MSATPRPADRHARVSVERQPVAGFNPVGQMQAELDSRLRAGEYDAWLLPPEPRDAMEQAVHLFSLAAGVIALTLCASLLWLMA